MSFNTIRRADTFYEDDTYGSFPLPFSGKFCSEELAVSEDGRRAVLGVLCQDDFPQDPIENYDEGEFVQFNSRYIHSGDRPEIDAWKRIIRENPGRVFTICTAGAGYAIDAGPFSVKDTKDIKTCIAGGKPYKWLISNGPAESALDESDGYYVCPADVTDPAAYAAGVLESYTAFCNGDVYGVCIWQFTREPVSYGLDGLPDTDEFTDWELTDRDQECWGYLGSKYAEEELASQFKTACTDLNSPPPDDPAGQLSLGV
jgi:hypothetical protein